MIGKKTIFLNKTTFPFPSVHRPNLSLAVALKCSSMLKDLKSLMVNSKFDGPTIIYCQSKKKTGEIVDTLRTIGIRCDCYHAGLSMSTRKMVQKMFLSDEIDVI